jgi:hypothetical protein
MWTPKAKQGDLRKCEEDEASRLFDALVSRPGLSHILANKGLTLSRWTVDNRPTLRGKGVWQVHKRYRQLSCGSGVNHGHRQE